jgi:RNA polymerase sigma factor (sigma-70 family)
VDTAREKELLSRCRAGRTEAYEPLVRFHQDHAFRIATALLGDADEAADAVQDAFVAAYRSLGKLSEGSPFGPWFRTILRNDCRDRLRSPRRRSGPVTEEALRTLGENRGASELAEQNELAGIIHSGLAALSVGHREILVMKELEGLNYAEIAAATGIPAGTVASRLHHARMALKKALLDRGLTMEEVI